MSLRICPVCGMAFKQKTPAHTYCSVRCREIADQRKYKSTHYQRLKEREKRIRSKRKDAPISIQRVDPAQCKGCYYYRPASGMMICHYCVDVGHTKSVVNGVCMSKVKREAAKRQLALHQK